MDVIVPDGDALDIQWTGCTQGTDRTADCVVQVLGVHTATIIATDEHGATAQASASAEGVNQAPTLRFGTTRPPSPALPNTHYVIAGGQPTDSDGDEDENVLCSRTTLTVSGPCVAEIGACGGVGDVFDVELRTGAGPGSWFLEASTRDSWGGEGHDRLVIRVEVP